MGTLLNKSGRVNTSYWQIHEAFASKTPHPLSPHFLSAQKRRWSGSCGNCALWEVNTQPLGFWSVSENWGTGKMAPNWGHARRETMQNQMHQDFWPSTLTLPKCCTMHVFTWICIFCLKFCLVQSLPPTATAGFSFQGCKGKRVVLPILCSDHLEAEHVPFFHTDGEPQSYSVRLVHVSPDNVDFCTAFFSSH